MADICVEPEIRRIALIDGPSVVGWARWREVCQRHVFGLARGHARAGIETGRIRAQPVRPLAHVLMGASDEAALYVAEAADPGRARAEMIEVLDRLIDVRIRLTLATQIDAFRRPQCGHLVDAPGPLAPSARDQLRRQRGHRLDDRIEPRPRGDDPDDGLVEPGAQPGDAAAACPALP